MQVLKINNILKAILIAGLIFVYGASHAVFAYHTPVDPESSQWCEDNRPDSEFEECMWEQFGIDVTSTHIYSGNPDFEEVDDRPMCVNPDGSTKPGVPISGTDPNDGDNCLEFDEETASLEDNPIFTYLGIVINFLLGGVGIALVAVIVIGGYQYMTSRGDPQKVSGAKKKIGFAVVGMIMYLLAAAFLNWLVPGGLI